MTKVSPVSDLSSFLATLEKSGLLSAAEVSKFGDSLSPGADPKSAARELLKQNKLTRWQAGQLLHGYHQLVYGKYKLLDQIGSGEMGRVYLAEHGQLGRRVALKALSRRHTADPKILKAFLEDARRVGALDHPNLCHMYDVNQEADRYFLVMEYVEGQNLQKFVESVKTVPIAKAIEIVRQTAEGLGHAHELKVLHGDLKPTNIVIDKQGVVKILDIGLARLTEVTSAAGVDDTGEAPSLASGIYRPQEQIDGKGIDQRSDWYSLGAVLCYLLTGKPFQQPDSCRSVEQLKKLRPDAPESLLRLCASLLAANPADRPGSQEEVVSAVAAAEKTAAAAPAAKPPALPRAKAEATRPAAKTDSNAGKPKKPPVARPLSDTPSGTAEDTVESPTDAFAFNLNTNGASAAKKPPAKRTAAAGASAAVALNTGEPTAPAGEGSGPQPAAKAGSSKLPLIIGGAIGGGVLLIALVVGLAIFFLSGGDTEQVAQNSAADPTNASANVDSSDANLDEADSVESNPVEANPVEANPAPANPAEAEAPAGAAMAEAPSSAEGSDSEAAATEAAPPAEEQDPSTPPADEPAVEAAPAPAAVPEKKADPPQPAASKPAGNPFAGFNKSVALPKLPAAGTEPTTESLAEVPLGPCKVDEKALIIVRLIGGETAFKGGRQKFLFDAAEGGTADRDWEVRLGSESESEVVAMVSAKNQQIFFQWTPEGAKNPAAPYLSNCMLELSAGAGKHQCALREPVQGEPLVIDLEKPNAAAKWLIDALPDESQMEVEVVAFQSGAPKSRVENNTLTEDKPITNVLLGPSDDKLPLAFELKMSSTPRQIEVKAIPKLKLEGLPPGRDRFTKKVVQQIVAGTAAQLQQAELRHMQANQIKDSNQKKRALEQADVFKAEVAKANEMAQALQAAAESAKTSTVHFRVWYLAENSKVLLLDTGGPPPAAAKN